MLMAWPLPPATRRLVGWLFLLAGALLLTGVGLRLYVLYDAYQRLGAGAVASTQLVIYLMMVVGGVMMLRYGWREWRGNDTVD